MQNRVYAIDFLRGLAIIGMVFSGQIVWDSELPAWMFHAQTPPPYFKLDQLVYGITWVDLVFPFFLFSMGVAMSISLSKRKDRAESNLAIVKSVAKRFFLLAFFAVALANFRTGSLGDISAWVKSLIQMVLWLFFCVMFVRVPKLTSSQNNKLNLLGIVGVAVMFLFVNKVYGVNVSFFRSDIIILVLANMAMFGSLIWLFTRCSTMVRLGVIALIVALKLSSSIQGTWTSELWAWSPVSWLFKFEFFKYLCIILPATIIGDIIIAAQKKASDSEIDEPSSKIDYFALVAMVVLFFTNMWGLFSRELVVNFSTTLVVGFLLLYLLWRAQSTTQKTICSIYGWSLFWLMLGLVIEPFEGGIRKDAATYSYFFVTSGLAGIVVCAVSIVMRRFQLKFSWVVDCGQNPMIAYTASGFLIMPLLTLTHLSPYLASFAEMHPWLGVARGAIVTILMMCITIFFTRKKIFWRT